MPDTPPDIETRVREILQTHGKLMTSATAIEPGADLYKAGLSSLATVNVMLEIENRFGIAIPDEALTRATFQSIAALTALVQRMEEQDAA